MDIYSFLSHYQPCLNQFYLAKTFKIASFIPKGCWGINSRANRSRSTEHGEQGSSHGSQPSWHPQHVPIPTVLGQSPGTPSPLGWGAAALRNSVSLAVLPAKQPERRFLLPKTRSCLGLGARL